MPLLSRVRFRNVVLREVIERMSLTREGKGRRRGRVSYSQLGINQLGAVYEALLSFRGFFADVDLYEVQPAPKKAKAACLRKACLVVNCSSHCGQSMMDISPPPLPLHIGQVTVLFPDWDGTTPEPPHVGQAIGFSSLRVH